MDSTVEIQSADVLEPRSDKRRAPEDGHAELGEPTAKRGRGDGGELDGDVKKVAEIVLVLAAMGMMRGGRNPSDVEREMMAEAREKLVDMCEGFAPKDVFPPDAFGTVIEDLGLNKLREQRLGFRTPKMSIAEKLLFTKRKMEKSEELPLHSAPCSSQRPPTNLGAAADSRGASSNPVRVFPSDRPSHAPISSGALHPASALGHVPPANSTSLSYQLPTSEVRPVVSGGFPSSQLGRDSTSLAAPRVERSQFRLDGRLNGSPYTSQVQANSSGDHTQLRTPTWSLQPQSALSAKVGLENKLPAHTLVKVEGGADASSSRLAPQLTPPKPAITAVASTNLPGTHQNLQGMNLVQAPAVLNSHNEIVKIVQKQLQPKLPQHPTWDPPSRDYMNKTFTCQICKLTVHDVDSVLVCDACEKGFHIKCLQAYNLKVIPRGEWHCQKCMTMSKGKPLPPKYGRVMRNINNPKVNSSTPVIHSPLEKKVGTQDTKVNQQKMMENGNTVLQNAPAAITGNNSNHSPSIAKISNAQELRGTEVLPNEQKIDNNLPPGSCPSNSVKTSTATCVSFSVGLSDERSCERNLVAELKPYHLEKSETVTSPSCYSQVQNSFQGNAKMGLPNSAEVLVRQHHDDNLPCKESENSHVEESSACNSVAVEKQGEQGVGQADSVSNSATTIDTRQHVRASSGGLHDVDWAGEVLQIVDGRKYYQSCRVKGILYKVRDYALIQYNNKLRPFKLQAMWEDSINRSKRIVVNSCFFPRDLPEGVGRPCSSESNEVYESNHENTMMAGLIQGPCDVFPPGKFIEESERRTRVGKGGSDGSRPLFQCRWFYDELKHLFRDVSI